MRRRDLRRDLRHDVSITGLAGAVRAGSTREEGALIPI